jgi:hypothetical protein
VAKECSNNNEICHFAWNISALLVSSWAGRVNGCGGEIDRFKPGDQARAAARIGGSAILMRASPLQSDEYLPSGWRGSLYLSNIPAAKLSSINLRIAPPDREAKNRRRLMYDSAPFEIGKT